MKTNYQKKLEDPRWQRKRLEVMNRAEWLCQICGKEDEQLQVHHPKYRQGREPWDYENLICICRTCHSRIHPQAALPYHDPFWNMVKYDAEKGNIYATELLARKPSNS